MAGARTEKFKAEQAEAAVSRGGGGRHSGDASVPLATCPQTHLLTRQIAGTGGLKDPVDNGPLFF